MREASPAGDGALRNLLGMFGLSGEKVFQDANTLSGGEKTKLALAQLVAGRHNVLLLDEPTNNLDPSSRTATGEALAAWPGTMIVVSHDVEFVRSLAPDRALLMPDGTLDYFDDDMLDAGRARLSRFRAPWVAGRGLRWTSSTDGVRRIVEHLEYPMFVVAAAADGDADACLVGFTTQCSIDPSRFAAFLSKVEPHLRARRRASTCSSCTACAPTSTTSPSTSGAPARRTIPASSRGCALARPARRRADHRRLRLVRGTGRSSTSTPVTTWLFDLEPFGGIA